MTAQKQWKSIPKDPSEQEKFDMALRFQTHLNKSAKESYEKVDLRRTGLSYMGDKRRRKVEHVLIIMGTNRVMEAESACEDTQDSLNPLFTRRNCYECMYSCKLCGSFISDVIPCGVSMCPCKRSKISSDRT